LHLADVTQPEFEPFQIGQRAVDQADLAREIEESRAGIGLALVADQNGRSC
jgi:hypothetical protein